MHRQVEVVSLLAEGPQPFDDVLAMQHAARERVRAGGPETLFLLEHQDVITIGRNAERSDLLVSEAHLEKLGVALRVVDRGGKLTFHGPGQLVVYPVFDLSPDRRDVRRYVRDLEEALLRTVARWGIAAERSAVAERWSSIWVGNDKLAAIGVHLSRWITTHGAALNVATNLARFSLIVPCGIADGGVTSLQRLHPASPPPTIPEVAEELVRQITTIFGRSIAPGSGVFGRSSPLAALREETS